MKFSSRRMTWKQLTAASVLFIAGCDHFNPLPETCPDFDPPCSQRQYSLSLSRGISQLPSRDTAHVDDLPLSIGIDAWSPGASALTKNAKTNLSCAGCGDFFRPDSVYFTTVLVTNNGDSLPAGYNFTSESKPVGIKHFNSSWIGIDSIQGFRDSVFQVRFVGTVDSVAKSASMTLHITNPALLLP